MFNKKILIEVNLKHLIDNYLKIIKKLNSKTKISAVIKSNAYGLGIFKICSQLIKKKCKNFWVYTIDEAIKLIPIKTKINIYILGSGTTDYEFKIAKKHGFKFVIYDLKQLNNFIKSEYNNLPIVLNFDTGIGRDGLQIKNYKFKKYRKINTILITTHLASAEKPYKKFNNKQLTLFFKIKKLFPNTPVSISNSAGILLGSQYHFDMVRCGGLIYGINVKNKKSIKVKAVVSIIANILSKKTLYKNSSIGYNSTYKANKGDKILLINCGYYNGFTRILSNNFFVYIHGYYLPIIGILSMNIITVNANCLPHNMFKNIKYVEIIGKKIKLEYIAKSAYLDPREILTNFSMNEKIYKH